MHQAGEDGDHFEAGRGLQAEGRLREAVEQYRQAARIGPVRAEIFGQLGRALTQLGLYDEAVWSTVGVHPV